MVASVFVVVGVSVKNGDRHAQCELCLQFFNKNEALPVVMQDRRLVQTVQQPVVIHRCSSWLSSCPSVQ